MIVQKDFLNKLKDFGINSYEAKLWTALLSRGVATAGELSDMANVPRSRSYDVLESLERKGFVVMKLGKPIKYIAVPPVEVIERVKKSVKDDAVSKEKMLDELKVSSTISELDSLFKQGIDMVDPSDLTGAVRGRGNLYSHLSFLFKNAEKSINIVTTAEGLVRKGDCLKNQLNKAKERGVRVKIIAKKGKKAPSASLSKIAQIKAVEDIPARFCVIDGKKITFMVLDDVSTHPDYDFGVWVNAGGFAKSFENMFGMLWNQK